MSKGKKILTIILIVAFVLGGAYYFLQPYILNITFGISDYFRDRGLTTPEDVVRVDDQKYGEDKMQVFDVYYPVGTDHPLPVIVSMHGGGYTYGSKEVYQYYCMNLAQHGFTVVNYSYRLAPKHKYPAQLEDTNEVMKVICANADKYYIDLNNVFFVGDSAGGHLNAQYTAAVTNPTYAKLLGLEIPKFKLRATALNCGAFTMIQAGGGHSGTYLEGDPAQYEEQLDILGHITSEFAPSFVMSSTGDMCLPYAQPMYDLLQSKNVTSELHIYGDEKNKLPHVFHINIRSEDANKCNDDECEFFRKFIEEQTES